MKISKENIQNIWERIFKKLVKDKTDTAAFKDLKMKQNRGSKGADIKYTSIVLQDHLNPFANMMLEDQRYLFSLWSKPIEIKKIVSKKTETWKCCIV